MNLNTPVDLVLAILLLTDFGMAGASRLMHCIRLAACQGLLIGLLPLVMWHWHDGVPHFEMWLVAAVSVLVKGILLPVLLKRAMIRAQVRRELEPLIGYSLSLLIVLGVAGAAFYFCGRFGIVPPSASVFSAPVAFTTILTGLFIIVARKKAITQAIGFLIFENGISIFGIGMMVEYGLIVELGILLDVFVLIFVMGIAVFQIRREFSHIDADRLNQLSDRIPGSTASPDSEPANERSAAR